MEDVFKNSTPQRIVHLTTQAGDVTATYANVDGLTNAVGFKPPTPIETGVDRLVEWYRNFYQV
jgi:UDP-glucuronate 4-epimerase